MRKTLTRRDFLNLLTIAGVGGAGVSMLRAEDAKQPKALEPGRMNAIVVILDSLRKDHVGIYGNDWIQTPTLDALAKESLRFTRAYPESLPTIPSRRAIHTGLRTFPFRNWVPQKGDPISARVPGWQRIPEEQTTLAEILRPAGYETLMVSDCYHMFRPSMNFSRDFSVVRQIQGQEEDSYQPYWLTPEDRLKKYLFKGPAGEDLEIEGKLRQYLANTTQRKTEADWFAPQVFSAAADLLEEVSQRQPFLMVVDSFDPHEPWDPPQDYVDLYDSNYQGPEPIIPFYGKRDYLSDRQLKRFRALYAGEVTLADRWLGHFLDKAKDLELMQNTVLLVLSDHGMALGEHGVTGKLSDMIGPELTDIPFLLRHPQGKGAGQTSKYFASTHDIAPTVLGMLGLEPPVPMEGENLAVLLDGKEPAPRPYFTLSYGKHVWARDDRYVLICRNNGLEARLYDLQSDPAQDHNLAADLPKIVEGLYGYIQEAAGGPLPTYAA